MQWHGGLKSYSHRKANTRLWLLAPSVQIPTVRSTIRSAHCNFRSVIWFNDAPYFMGGGFVVWWWWKWTLLVNVVKATPTLHPCKRQSKYNFCVCCRIKMHLYNTKTICTIPPITLPSDFYSSWFNAAVLMPYAAQHRNTTGDKYKSQLTVFDVKHRHADLCIANITFKRCLGKNS